MSEEDSDEVKQLIKEHVTEAVTAHKAGVVAMLEELKTSYIEYLRDNIEIKAVALADAVLDSFITKAKGVIEDGEVRCFETDEEYEEYHQQWEEFNTSFRMGEDE